MSFFGRRREREGKLLQTLLEAENKRIEMAATVETQRLQLEQRRLELEFEHIEEASEQKRKDAEAREQLRKQRREWAAQARDKKAQNAQRRLPGMSGGTDPSTCPVCRNPGDHRLTAEEIKAHHAHLNRAAVQ